MRTAEQILGKNEQIIDGMERGVLSPKMAEQMSQCVKTPILLARVEMQFLKMVEAMGRKARVPHSPLVRSLIGLDPSTVDPGDGDKVRALIGEE